MIAAWMIYSISIGAMLAIVAMLLDRVSRARGAPARVIWLGSMIATVLLTASVVWRGDGARPIATRSIAGAAEASVVAGVSSAREGTVSAAPGEQTAATTSWVDRQIETFSVAAARGWPLNPAGEPLSMLGPIDYALLATWMVLTTLALALIVASIARLRARRSSWRPGAVGETPILITDGLGPVVVGILDSAIAVPAWLADLPAAQQRLVIEHERQHLAARDPLVMLGGLVMASLLPWNPAMWLLVRRLRRSTEMDCDRRVLRALPAPGEYAALLIDIGARSMPPGAISPALADSGSDLESRVDQILRVGRRVATSALVLQVTASGLLLIAACAAPKPRVQLAAPEPAGAAVATPAARDTAATRAVPRDSALRAVAVQRDSAARASAVRSDAAARATAMQRDTASAAAAARAVNAAAVAAARLDSTVAVLRASAAAAAAARSDSSARTSAEAARARAAALQTLAQGRLATARDSARLVGASGRGVGGQGALAVMTDSARAAFLSGARGTGRGAAGRGAGVGAIGGVGVGARGTVSRSAGGYIASCAPPFSCEGSSLAWSSSGFVRSGRTGETQLHIAYGSANPPREFTSDTLAALAAKHFRRLFDDATPGTPVLVFSLDTLGQVVETKSIPPTAIAARRPSEILEEAFPGSASQWLATGHVAGMHTPPGLPGRWLYIVFGFKR